MEKLLAVVICGGESRRMGKDKGMIQKNGVFWAKIIYNIFDSLQIPYVVSINPAQLEGYSAIFAPHLLITDQNVPVKGPLKGLLSVHNQHPEKNLLLIACDMIDMEVETVAELLDAYLTDRGYDFYGYQTTHAIEPFCSIYSSGFLQQIMFKAHSNLLDRFSMQNVIKSGRQMILSAPDLQHFKNYNTPDIIPR